MRLIDALAGRGAGALMAALRWMDPDRASATVGALARRLGPGFPVHRTGRANLRAAYPDSDPDWIEATLSDVWENLGRVAGEYVHLGQLWDHDEDAPDPDGRITISSSTDTVVRALRDDGRPALMFAAHLGNWELPAVAAFAHRLPSAVVYRMPNNRGVADRISAVRAPIMGRLVQGRREGVFEMSAALERGEHLGMLVDQHFSRGPAVTFFGRTARANPTLARLARQFDCPVVGARVIRRGGARFEVEVTPPLDLPRDAEGRVDVAGTAQVTHATIEGWVREHPGQWLWLHRRWRGDATPAAPPPPA